jgi:hypothetical protein
VLNSVNIQGIVCFTIIWYIVATNLKFRSWKESKQWLSKIPSINSISTKRSITSRFKMKSLKTEITRHMLVWLQYRSLDRHNNMTAKVVKVHH